MAQYAAFGTVFGGKNTGNSETLFGAYGTSHLANRIKVKFGEDLIPIASIINYGLCHYVVCKCLATPNMDPTNKELGDAVAARVDLTVHNQNYCCVESLASFSAAVVTACSNKGRDRTKNEKDLKCIYHKIGNTAADKNKLITTEVSTTPSVIYPEVKAVMSALNIDIENENIRKVLNLILAANQVINKKCKHAMRPNTGKAEKMCFDVQHTPLVDSNFPQGRGVSPNVPTCGFLSGVEGVRAAKENKLKEFDEKTKNYCESVMLNRTPGPLKPVVSFIFRNYERKSDAEAIYPHLANMLTLLPPATDPPACCPIFIYCGSYLGVTPLPKVAKDGTQLGIKDQLFNNQCGDILFHGIAIQLKGNGGRLITLGAGMPAMLWLLVHGAEFDNLSNLSQLSDSCALLTQGCFTLASVVGYPTQMGKFKKIGDLGLDRVTCHMQMAEFKTAPQYGRGMTATSVYVQPQVNCTFKIKRSQDVPFFHYTSNMNTSVITSANDAIEYLKREYEAADMCFHQKGGPVKDIGYVTGIILGFNANKVLHEKAVPQAFSILVSHYMPDTTAEQRKFIPTFWEEFRRLAQETDTFSKSGNLLDPAANPYDQIIDIVTKQDGTWQTGEKYNKWAAKRKQRTTDPYM